MTKDEVLRYVGQPRERTYDDHFEKGSAETWYFDDYESHTRAFQPHWVRFAHGRVTACEFDHKRVEQVKLEKQIAAAKRVQAEIIPADVGFKCSNDSQCSSGKCLNAKCAGPRDCTTAAGAECYSNLDCCSLRCNFGTRTCY